PRRARREGDRGARRVLRRQPRQASRRAPVALPAARAAVVRAAARRARARGGAPGEGGEAMTVSFTVDGPVALVTIERPEARNAVDGPTAAALVEAFTRFDADPALAVAVLAGAGGTFCAGADLKSFGAGGDRANRVAPDGAGPLGPTRMLL